MLNEKRYESLKEILKELNISIPDDQVKAYSNIFEYIAHITENMFTDKEMVAIYDVLGGVLEGKYPHIAAVILKDEKVRTLVRVLEELPLTAGKLSMEVKLRIAFCELAITGLHTQPEGVVFDWYDSFESAEAEFNHFRKNFPTWFDVNKNVSSPFTKKGYGLIKENPIQTTSVHASYAYLKRLKYRGKPIAYERVGSSSDARGNILDVYKAYAIKGIFSKRKEFIGNLFINTYCNKEIPLAPEGYTLCK